MHEKQRKICLHSQCMFYGIDHAEKCFAKKNFESRLNQQKLSNKISFYYPFIEFIDLTTNIQEGNDDTSNPLAQHLLLLLFIGERVKETSTINTVK